MNRRWIRAAAFAAASTFTLTACGNGVLGIGGSDDGRTVVKIVAADYGTDANVSSASFWSEAESAFEAEHPDIDIVPLVLPWTEIDAEVEEMIQEGDTPDLVQSGSYAGYAAEGLLYPASEYMSVRLEADLIPSYSEAGRVDGTLYGLPFVASTRMLFYNEDMFREADIALPPTTWDRLAEVAKALKDEGVEVPYGLPLGPEEPQAETMVWMMGNTGGYTDAAGNWTINSEQNVDALNWVRANLVEPGLTQPNPEQTNRQDVFQMFAGGGVGMVVGHPALLLLAEHAGLEFGVAPLPGRLGAQSGTLGAADWMMAFRENGHAAEIREFLDYLYQPEKHYSLVDEYGLLPVTDSATQLMQERKADDENLQKMIDLLPYADPYPAGEPAWSEVTARLKETIGTAMTTSDPESVLDDLQAVAEQADASAAAE
ncbi:extracellular solute-binding protein [Allostreptomyces psammosilenae]|uniref:Multiple sugar transport system substrate-binding protein n=1 Tax=Allostreptomyces psammosilenae TaxID=1892865 RepID=A0A852ZZ59_9ACTN|nr:extracellular solute-binding protein [Allostreptomyces psammosilenae]NYI07626.1 multiple sugar transport system substrate-binding protein [Allostreptomyces psammosilenae]